MIRPATLDDAETIATLEVEVFGAEAWTRDQVVEELTGPGRAGWVSSNSTGVVDGYVITWTNGDTTDLQRIAVEPVMQGRGLAAELLAAARPETPMLLEVAEDNERAIAFYRKHGFVEIDRRPRYYRNGATAIVMSYGK